MLGFIDTMRAEGHAAWSICQVLREQGHQIAARTYRSQRRGVVAAQTITDAQVADAVRDAAWTAVVDPAGRKRRKLTPEGLYGRRKMIALIRRTTIPGKDGVRAGDLLNRDFTAPRAQRLDAWCECLREWIREVDQFRHDSSSRVMLMIVAVRCVVFPPR